MDSTPFPPDGSPEDGFTPGEDELLSDGDEPGAPDTTPPYEAPTVPGLDPTQPGIDPAQPGAAQPGIAQPGPTQPGIAQPGPTQPGIAQPSIDPAQPGQPKWQPLPGPQPSQAFPGGQPSQPFPGGQPSQPFPGGQPSQPGSEPPPPGWGEAPPWAAGWPPPGSYSPGYPPSGYPPSSYPGYGPPGGYNAPGGYGPPPGYTPPGYTPAGSGPPGYTPPGYTPPGYNPSGSEPPRKARRHLLTLAVVAVIALVAAATGIGVALGDSHTQPPAKDTASQSIPHPSSSSPTSGKIDVSKIARTVDPETVDIDSILSTEGDEDEGTGIILTSDGEVLTNNHVVDEATSISAQVDGTGTRYKVKVLGVDPVDDVALVQLEGASGLPHASIGNSSKVQVGDPVVAIGNALGLGGTPTVTSGIVSALHRSILASDEASGAVEHLHNLLQTDAPINPGNSGGPLVDAAGQVIGMDTAAATGSSTQSATDIGFAIPINEAIAIAQEIQQGKASDDLIIGERGYMGVEVESIATAEQAAKSDCFFSCQSLDLPVSKGAYVAGTVSGDPAARAGMAVGDVIVAFDGKTITSADALENVAEHKHPGTTVSVTWVDPSGKRHTASLTLVSGPVA